MVKRTVPESDILVTLRLPRDLHAKLKEAGGERGMTEQVRSRLQASFGSSAEPIKDPEMRDLAERIGRAAQALAAEWQPNRAFYAALAGAISELIDSKREKAEPGEELVPIAPGRKPISIERGIERALTIAELWELRDVL